MTAPTPDAGVDVEALRGLLEKATPSPWAAYANGDILGQSENPHVAHGKSWNVALIAAAVNALPALLDEVERLREAAAHFEAEYEDACRLINANGMTDVEALAEVLSWTSGEMTRYDPDAHEDRNRWSWRGSWRGNGHGEAIREDFRRQAAEVLAAMADLRLSGVAQSDEQGSPGIRGRFKGSEALVAPCSRCGVSQVVNGRPNDDIVVCEQCAWACGGRAALENAAARCHNGAGDPEQEFYDVGVAPWLTERALEWEKRIDETKERA